MMKIFENANTFENALEIYRKNSAAKIFILGMFITLPNRKKVVKALMTDLNFALEFTRLDHKDGKKLIRADFNKVLKRRILKDLKDHTKTICNFEAFNKVKEENELNNGETFEKLVHDFLNLEYKRDNIPFNEKGDITIKGIEIQVKFEGATFAEFN